METSILLPDFGASSARLSVWFADAGDWVYEGDRLVEVLVDGATFDVPAPATGRLTEKKVRPDQLLAIGQLLGIMKTENE